MGARLLDVERNNLFYSVSFFTDKFLKFRNNYVIIKAAARFGLKDGEVDRGVPQVCKWYFIISLISVVFAALCKPTSFVYNETVVR